MPRPPDRALGIRTALVAVLSLALVGAAGAAAKLTLRSPAFAGGSALPVKHTCDGANVSPALVWANVPKKAKELAVVMDDPDAPGGTFTHWIAWGISPKAKGLGEGKSAPFSGRNDAGALGYFGACPPPPDGPHRYVFTLYALKQKLTLPRGATRSGFDAATRGKVLAKAALTGTFDR